MHDTKLISELIGSVKTHFTKRKSIQTMVAQIIKDVGLEPTSVLRRNFDGCSELSWLVEKMIGELLIDGKINN